MAWVGSLCFDTISFCIHWEQKFLLHLAVHIVYLLLILIVVFIYALRKYKSNTNSGGQTPVGISSTTSIDGDTSSGQIAMALINMTTMALT